ncbi:hypothetical protein LTS08_004196 [Lithohypha guttulata]|uniref:uncharacterized protein n=1 Tax=Lithohypha guttulata TaxID=1690604 RepID=UPI002DE16C38|nr:hypothetical protein LTR51_005754 [Lithohypha guttulata]KAK5101737.1 hypothetical protein LTS08_004196 [Lithohypha guttulata]
MQDREQEHARIRKEQIKVHEDLMPKLFPKSQVGVLNFAEADITSGDSLSESALVVAGFLSLTDKELFSFEPVARLRSIKEHVYRWQGMARRVAAIKEVHEIVCCLMGKFPVSDTTSNSRDAYYALGDQWATLPPIHEQNQEKSKQEIGRRFQYAENAIYPDMPYADASAEINFLIEQVDRAERLDYAFSRQLCLYILLQVQTFLWIDGWVPQDLRTIEFVQGLRAIGLPSTFTLKNSLLHVIVNHMKRVGNNDLEVIRDYEVEEVD